MRVRTQRPKSFATDHSAVTKWIVPTIGRKRLDALTPADVRSVGEAIRSAGRTSSTERRAHIVLIRMLKDAIVEGHPVSQRLLLMDAPTKSVSDRDAIDIDDARALLRAAAQQPDGSRWLGALLQGLRQGERLGLTWPAINFVDQYLDVSWQLQALNYRHGCDRSAGRWACGRRFGGDCPQRLRSGGIRTATGRPIPPSPHQPAFCYVLADLTPTMISRCEYASLRPTYDGMGYFGFNEPHKVYIEVMSFDRLVKSATERNRAFFDKLGLPSA